MHHVYLGVGGNIGNKQQNLEKVRFMKHHHGGF